MQRVGKYMVVFIVLLMLVSCTAGPNELAVPGSSEVEAAGFWKGLWHGIIAPITFVISLFNENVTMYEVHHVAGWYNFGFLLGVMIIFSGSGGGACKADSERKRRKYESHYD
ncbi:MAG: hypothetical protein ACLFR1_12595 [Spirochaetia bacterium]